MRAVVDIGSNSVKFLAGHILRGAPKIHSSGSRVTRLAEKQSEGGGMLSEEALARTESAFAEFAQQIKDMEITAVATAAARKAKNSDRLAQIVRSTLGCEMRILSGMEEAEWSRKGATLAVQAAIPSQKNWVFVDMGGASTEISFSDSTAAKHSFPCGAVTFLEKLGLQEIPASDATWKKAKTGIGDFFPAADFNPLKEFSQTWPEKQIVAVGGTLVIAAKIANGGTAFPSAYGISVSRSKLSELNEKIRLMDRPTRMQLEGMEPGREDIVCGGLLALDFLLSNFSADSIFITGWGLRHGLLFGK